MDDVHVEVINTSPASQDPPPSPFARFTSALGLSRRAFAPPVRTNDWLVPILIVLILQMLSGIILHDLFVKKAADQMADARTRIEASTQMSAEQREAALERMDRAGGGAAIWISTLAGPVVGVLLLNLLLAALLMVILNFVLGAEVPFRTLWFIGALSWAPKAIETLLFIPLARARSSIDVAFGPAAFVAPDAGPLRKALEAFDLFDIWRLLIVVVGLMALTRVSRGKATGVALTLWILGWLITVALALIFGRATAGA